MLTLHAKLEVDYLSDTGQGCAGKQDDKLMQPTVVSVTKRL